MHPNPIFRKTDQQAAFDFAVARGFGQFVGVTDGAPVIAAAPFVAVDGELEAHLLRSNPLLRALPTDVTLIVSGPDSYVSPDWYEVEDQVPTWNYVAVHLRGPMRALEPQDLRAHLDRLSERFEAELAPKPIWRTEKMTPEVLAKMMRMIVPVRLTVESIDSTFKLSQNKTDEVRLRAADQMEKGAPGLDPRAVAAMMKALKQSV
ncbi:FMN-binding negative transcriptional regulator [Paracoccaceae bacterium GXU_MW_L88]